MKRIRENRLRGEIFKEAKFDDENLIIRNASLLGAESLNGYAYTERALEDAARMLEGAPQFLDHGSMLNTGRGVMDSFSRVRSVRYDRRAHKLFGDMELVDTPLIRNEVFPRMKQFADRFGNSIVAEGEFERMEDGNFVTSLTAVHSCDLVSDPATTKGLFEQIAPKDERACSPVRRSGAWNYDNKRVPNADRGKEEEKMKIEDVRSSYIPDADRGADRGKEQLSDDTGQSLNLPQVRSDGIAKYPPEELANVAVSEEIEAMKAENSRLRKEKNRLEEEKSLAEKKTFLEREISRADLPESIITESWRKMLLEKRQDEIKWAISEIAEAIKPIIGLARKNERSFESLNFEKSLIDGSDARLDVHIGDFYKRVFR